MNESVTSGVNSTRENYRRKTEEQREIQRIEKINDPEEYWFERLKHEWEALVFQSYLEPGEAAETMNLDFDMNKYDKEGQGYVDSVLIDAAHELALSKPVEYIDKVILPPNAYPRIITGAAERTRELQIIPRDQYLEQVLESLDLDYHILETSPQAEEEFRRRHKMRRNELYRAYVVDEEHIIVLVNNEEGNSTFVLHDITREQWNAHILGMDKEHMVQFLQTSATPIEWISNVDEWKTVLKYFLETKGPRYLSYTDLQHDVLGCGVTSSSSYEVERKNHVQWPSEPFETYKDEWTNWYDFLKKERQKEKASFLTYMELQAEVRSCDPPIMGSERYRQESKKHPNWPSNPNHVYGEWVDWYSFLGKTRISLETLMEHPEMRQPLAQALSGVKIVSHFEDLSPIKIEGATTTAQARQLLDTMAKEIEQRYTLPRGSVSRKRALTFIRLLATQDGEAHVEKFIEDEARKKDLTLEELYRDSELCRKIWEQIGHAPVHSRNKVTLSIEGYRVVMLNSFLQRVGHHLTQELKVDGRISSLLSRQFIGELVNSGREEALEYVKREMQKKYISAHEILNNRELRAHVVSVLERSSIGKAAPISFQGFEDTDTTNALSRVCFFLRRLTRSKVSAGTARDYILRFEREGKQSADTWILEKS
ncbi:MAG: hypothetical protein WCW16_00665 [Candidatus Magasanikbacteria bacterium]